MPHPAVRRARAALLLATLAAGPLAAACARSPRGANRGAPTPQLVTTVRVQNQNFLDMNVYVIQGQGGARSRLGTATGNSTTRFTIPATLVYSLVQLRFLADPIGGRRSPVSEQITVSPGDEVTLTIPPN